MVIPRRIGDEKEASYDLAGFPVDGVCEEMANLLLKNSLKNCSRVLNMLKNRRTENGSEGMMK